MIYTNARKLLWLYYEGISFGRSWNRCNFLTGGRLWDGSNHLCLPFDFIVPLGLFLHARNLAAGAVRLFVTISMLPWRCQHSTCFSRRNEENSSSYTLRLHTSIRPHCSASKQYLQENFYDRLALRISFTCSSIVVWSSL